ncbi:MAG: response regulator transcription factor [Lachnospiraceae bacterium]|nr:response regulator transcription factor [Lachnospiraceae bacterium]
MYRIGILEDDLKIGSELKLFLEKNGYEAEFITPDRYAGISEDKMTDLLLEADLSLLLLDISLPGFDGIRICKAFRDHTGVPVIMITSDNSELTELMSIQSGADDFVPKPFNTRILLARIESVLRRVYSAAAASSDVKEVRLSGGGVFKIDLSKGKISSDGFEETELTKNELHILRLLVSEQGKIVSRDKIMEELWDNEAFVDDNTLTVNMTRLKGKLEQIGIRDAITTKRGMGYLLN